MRKAPFYILLVTGTLLSGCSLAPDFTLPEAAVPHSYKEALPDADDAFAKGQWEPAQEQAAADRGEWWGIFGDEHLAALEREAVEANQSLKAMAARVEQSRALAQANIPSLIPNLDVGGNALRAQPASASLAAFGGNTGIGLRPYTLYSGQGVLSYEVDLFGRVRDSYAAYLFDAEAQEAAYHSALLALQADVAQQYFFLRALDAERKLLQETVAIRAEAVRIMQRKYEAGAASEADTTRTQSELASVKAELIALDAQRAQIENALAVLLGKVPSEFTLAEMPLDNMPPVIPVGLPSELLQRRPDIAAAVAGMAAANARIGVARTAFFPKLLLTASGGYQSAELGELFAWSARTWALGQMMGSALTMPVFDSGRNQARLDASKAAYEESVAHYRQQVLLAFRDVEDNLAIQRLLAEQSREQDIAAAAASRTTELTEKRYREGDVDYFQVVDAQRISLAAERGAVRTRGERFLVAVALVRALGGGWDIAAGTAEKVDDGTAMDMDMEDVALAEDSLQGIREDRGAEAGFFSFGVDKDAFPVREWLQDVLPHARLTGEGGAGRAEEAATPVMDERDSAPAWFGLEFDLEADMIPARQALGVKDNTTELPTRTYETGDGDGRASSMEE